MLKTHTHHTHAHSPTTVHAPVQRELRWSIKTPLWLNCWQYFLDGLDNGQWTTDKTPLVRIENRFSYRSHKMIERWADVQRKPLPQSHQRHSSLPISLHHTQHIAIRNDLGFPFSRINEFSAVTKYIGCIQYWDMKVAEVTKRKARENLQSGCTSAKHWQRDVRGIQSYAGDLLRDEYIYEECGKCRRRWNQRKRTQETVEATDNDTKTCPRGTNNL